MNLVCLTKSCKFHGPICILCKKDHPNHNIVTIKNFVAVVAETSKKNAISFNKIEEKEAVEEPV